MVGYTGSLGPGTKHILNTYFSAILTLVEIIKTLQTHLFVINY